MQPESKGQDNPESDHEEQIGHSGDEQRNELGLPSIPSMSPQGDLLHDFKLAQVLANMNDYMQPESPLNLNLGATQSPEIVGDNKILSPLKDASHEVEIDGEAIWEVVHQFGDTLPVENSQVGLSTEDIGQGQEVEIEMLREADIQLGDTILLEQSQDEKPSSLEA